MVCVSTYIWRNPVSDIRVPEIGAWQHIDRSRIQSYTEMEVWDGVSDARISFDWQSTDRPVSTSTSSQTATQKIVAYMTENLNLSSALLSRLASLGGVSLFDNTRVGSISYGPETPTVDLRTWPVLTLSSGQVIAARLLVGADGANSPVRTFAGITSRGWDYNRHGVVATMQLSQPTTTNSPHDAIAYQRFLPTGPIALLPLPSNLATLVWTTTPAHAAFLKTLSLIDFTALVNAAFSLSPTDIAYMHTIPSAQTDELAWRLSHTAPAGGRIPSLAIGVQSDSIASFPLKMRHADAYTGQRIALVGDAAHSIHPLAGQGLNQGQLDIQALYSTIRTALANGSDIGAPLSLEDYPNERYAKNNTLLGVVDKLHKLYGTENPLVVGARSLGLRAVNGLGPLKAILMDVASGGSSARGAKTY